MDLEARKTSANKTEVLNEQYPLICLGQLASRQHPPHSRPDDDHVKRFRFVRFGHPFRCLCFSQRYNDIHRADVDTAITLNAQIVMDGGDSRLECDAVFDWAFVLAPFTGDTLYTDFEIRGLFVQSWGALLCGGSGIAAWTDSSVPRPDHSLRATLSMCHMHLSAKH